MLWQKEINSHLYTDLLNNVEYSQQKRLIHRRKNNLFAQSLRTQGNKKYSEENFESAYNYYNESVCFATSDSDDLSFAYANRSMCFFKLQLYDRCLLDIKLAKDSNYPERLMVKLNDRESQCMVRLQSSVQQIFIEPKLSFEPNKSLSGMANVLECQTTELYGRAIIAKCDIAIGETVIIEKDYLYTVDSDLNIFCSNCGKIKMNFVACKNCADATFCSIECADNNFHKFECDMTIGSDDICDGVSLTFLLRSVVIGINSFETTNEMMEHVQHWLLTTKLREIIESNESSKSKYEIFFKLTSTVSKQRTLKSCKIAFYAFHSIMSSPELACKFQTIAEKRFLVHLIIHHDFIIRTNSFESESTEARVQELGLLTSYLNHSCLPNVTKLNKRNLSICKTILPIKKGDQLFVTYISGDIFDMTSGQRNQTLQDTYAFTCKCQLCTFGRLQGGNIDNDPSFVYVATNILDDNFVLCNIENVIENCINFLLKYEHMTRSKEVAYISEMLSAMYARELKM